MEWYHSIQTDLAHLERLNEETLVSNAVFCVLVCVCVCVFGWLSCGNPLRILHRRLFSLDFKKHAHLSANDFSVFVCFYFIRVTPNSASVTTDKLTETDVFY